MKKLLIASALALTAFTAAPAFAEPHRGGDRYEQGVAYNERGYNGGYTRERLQRLEIRIDRGVRNGELNRWEARRLYSQLGELRDLARYYWRTDGISWREQRDLDNRFDRLSQSIRWQRHDNDYRGEGYRGDGYRGDGYGGYRR